MKRAIPITAVLLLCLAALPGAVHALGTPAATPILNRAEASYTINATPLTAFSNTETVTVDELVDVVVTWQDTPNVTVFPGDSDQPLTFLVTNTGNGTESFDLSVLRGLAGDDFTPAAPVLPTPSFYVDGNGNGAFDAGEDVTSVTLGMDVAVPVILFSDIPAGLGTDGYLGSAELTVISETAQNAAGGTSAGSIWAGNGDGGTDAVVGSTGGYAVATGVYEVLVTKLTLSKGSTVADPFGGTEPVPGATITYTVTVTVTGSGTAAGVVVTDGIPANTTYTGPLAVLPGVAGMSTAVAGSPLTATVDFGDLTSIDTPQTITFSVVID